MHKPLVELFAIACDYKQVPIVEWDVRAVKGRALHGKIHSRNGVLTLTLEDAQTPQSVSSLPQALRLAEDTLFARVIH